MGAESHDDARPAITQARLVAMFTAGAAALRTALGLGTMALATATDYLAKAGGTMTGDITTSTGQSVNNSLVGNGCSIPVSAYDISTWTQLLATNLTEAITTGVSGTVILWVSATASVRLSARYAAGTRITALLSGGAAANLSAGHGVVLLRPGTDSRMVAVLRPGNAALYVFQYSSKDAYVSTLTNMPFQLSSPVSVRLASRLGVVLAEYSIDGGLNWNLLYTADDATAFGAAGAGTHVGIAGYTGANGCIVFSRTPNLTVEA